jgi:aspartate aminotransferase
MLSRTARHLTRRARPLSAWAGVPAAPADPIVGLNQTFADDPSTTKVLLGVGAYRDDAGKPYVLPSIREAESRVVNGNPNHEYAAITGDAEFVKLSLEFAYGPDSAPLVENRVAAAQVLSGTGGLRVCAQLIERLPRLTNSSIKPVCYMPEPTWGNHAKVFQDAGVEVRRYRYLDSDTKTTLDYEGMKEDLMKAEAGSCILLHACAHNPTGVDPSPDQWRDLSSALKQTDLQLFFDCAYQGFASGDAEADAVALRSFVADGHQILLCQSYAKNFGLYGERVGALSAVCASTEEKAALESQLKAIIRPMYSSPPIHGARIVKEVLGDAALRAQWTGECKEMANRIQEMRSLLREGLKEAGSTKDWSHITDQIGMFAYTGLSKEQVQKMRDESAVYCTLDGRISVAGLNRDNVAYVAAAIHAVSK